MTQAEDRSRRIDALLVRALDEPPAARDVFLERECGEDRGLLEAVRRLLRYAESADPDLDTGAVLSGTFWEELAKAADEPPPARLDEVGAYRIVREIGRGGMAAVYLAERADAEFEQRVAIKVVHTGMASLSVLRRFRQERAILASLSHPSIAKLFDGGSTVDGRPFFAMELVEGEPIDRYCELHSLSLTARLELFLTVAQAVQYAHRNLVVHRDLKPSNVLVSHDGQIKLLDFGIAKLLDPTAEDHSLTQVSAVPMTPQCASPEQVRGEPITTATDIYQLGILLYQLLTGRYPYRVDSKDRHSLAKVICEQEPTRPSTIVNTAVDSHPENPDDGGSAKRRDFRPDGIAGQKLRGDLDSIVLMALRKEPDLRYDSVEQFAADVRNYLERRPVAARAGSLRYRAGKFLRRHQLGLGAAALVFVTLAGGIASTAWQAERADRRFQQVRQLANTFMFDFYDEIEYLSGATEARALLVDTALKYLDGLAQEAGDDPSLLAELAVAYQRVGDVQGDPRGASLGRTADAIESYRKSLEIVEGLAAEHADPVVRRALATGYFKVGDMVSEQGATLAGIEHLGTAVQHAGALLEQTGEEQDLVLLINIVARTGDAYLLARDIAAGIENHARVLELAESRLARFPSERAEIGMALAHTTLGGSLAQSGDLVSAFDHYAEAISRAEALAEKVPENRLYRRELRLVYNWMGNLLGGPYSLNLGEPDKALEYYRKALAISEELLAEDPASGYARHDLAVCFEKMGDMFLQPDARRSAEFHERALALADELLASSPEEFRFLRFRAANLRKLALAEAAGGDSEAALAHLQESLDLLRGLEVRYPANRELEPELHAGHLALGDISRSLGRDEDALGHYQAAEQLAEAAASSAPSDLMALWRRADSYERLGDFYASRARRAGADEQADWKEALSWYDRSAQAWQEWQRRGVAGDFNSRHERRVREAKLGVERAVATLQSR